MNNTQVAAAFAAGKTKGTGSHLFIDGDTIYSYGYHFPIARRLPDGRIWFTLRKYSQSTARHKSHVRFALTRAGKEIVTE